jgi:hypothetical protein
MNLSKSKLLAFRQCHRRLWLEVHRPELREDSDDAQAVMAAGNAVGEVARRLYDPANAGELIDIEAEGFDGALARSRNLLESHRGPVFEAGMVGGGALAFADVMLPTGEPTTPDWHMIEVKSAGSVKPYHRDDIAIQCFVARQAGVTVSGASIAHIDTSFVYPGQADYRGLLTEQDVTEEARSREDEVQAWIAQAHSIAMANESPTLQTGDQCSSPFDCGFRTHCESLEPRVEHPVSWLPRVSAKALKAKLAEPGVRSLDQVPDELLNAIQLRVKTQTLVGEPYFDKLAAAAEVSQIPLPALFLDFETIMFAVPVWAGTRPFQQIPFQYSLHRLNVDGALSHHAFLDLSGEDPSRRIAEDLVRECSGHTTIFAYNRSFEQTCLRKLAERFDDLREPLLAAADRVVDLLPIVQRHYYHPMQEGSWSLKAVLPALVPDLSYSVLDGVRDGGAAQAAYIEATRVDTTADRRLLLERQLLAYCHLDTLAMVKLREALLSAQ